MNRLLLIGSLAGLLIGTTGCLHHNTRGGCNTCSTGACTTGSCGECSGSCGDSCGGCNSSGGGGIIGKLKAGHGVGCLCGHSGCGPCGTGPIGWQQGGLDYSQHLKPGLIGHQSGTRLNARPFTPGPPTAQVAYPYYTIRGPRDFLMDNPPTIGR